jgi:hypothetical protein
VASGFSAGQRVRPRRTGQNTQPDPIGLAGGLNSYGFAAGDPVTYSDPYGLSAEENCCPQGFVDFVAGFGDAASFGITALVRQNTPGGDGVDYGSGAYAAGQATEFGLEVAATGGSAALRRAASRVSDDAARAAARPTVNAVRNGRRGGVVHHVEPLSGHPGGGQAMFPTRGLPASIHSARANLRYVTREAHQAAHQRLQRAERAARGFLDRRLMAARALLSAGRSNQ